MAKKSRKPKKYHMLNNQNCRSEGELQTIVSSFLSIGQRMKHLAMCHQIFEWSNLHVIYIVPIREVDY